MTKNKTILTFVLLLNLCSLCAQTDYRPGYIISLSNDTVFGKIDYRSNSTMGRVCRFLSEDGTKTEYSPHEIAAYRFVDSKYFVSREIEGEKYFLEYLVKGKLDIFYFKGEENEHYYIENDTQRLTELPYKEEIKRMDDTEYFHRSTLHVGILNFFTEDVPKLQTRINKIKKPEHRNLIKLAKDYHYAVCKPGEECLVFERPVPLFRIKGELVSGYVDYLSYTNLEEYFLYGARIYLWMPRTSENLYFKTGLLCMKGINTQERLFKIPLQIEYAYPKGTIRPTVSYGVNLFSFFFPLSALSLGLQAKISEKITFALNYELETASFLFLFPTHYLASHSLQLSAAYVFLMSSFDFPDIFFRLINIKIAISQKFI